MGKSLPFGTGIQLRRAGSLAGMFIAAKVAAGDAFYLARMERGSLRLALACAVGHTLLLACYTMPSGWIPARARYWSQAYARVLFHQDWRLFAPDPPACGCALEVKGEHNDAWTELSSLHDHFVWQRMCANACRFAAASPRRADGTILAPHELTLSLERMTVDLPRKGACLFRVHEQCDLDRYFAIEPASHR